MRFLRFAVVGLLLATAIFSCKKDNDKDTNTTPSTGVEGKWVGTYGFGIDAPTIYFCLNVKPGGVIEELNSSGASKGTGTWSLNGTTFKGHYQWKAPMNTIFSVEATYNPATGKIVGTWGYDNSATNGGKYEQTKQ